MLKDNYGMLKLLEQEQNSKITHKYLQIKSYVEKSKKNNLKNSQFQENLSYKISKKLDHTKDTTNL